MGPATGRGGHPDNDAGMGRRFVVRQAQTRQKPFIVYAGDCCATARIPRLTSPPADVGPADRTCHSRSRADHGTAFC
jgi:hypothetical protein